MCVCVCVCVCVDPVRAEKYQDAMIQARERMQRELDEKAFEHKQQMEEVSEGK